MRQIIPVPGLYPQAGSIGPGPTAPEACWTPLDMAKAIGIVVLGMLAVAVPTALVASALADGGDIDKDPEALTVVLGASFFLEVFLLGTAAYFSLIKYGLPWSVLGLRAARRGGWWLPPTLVMGALTVIYGYFAILGAFGVHPTTDLPEEAFRNLAPAVTLAVLSLIFAPIMEEMFFRGFIFGGLRRRWGTLGAALGSGALFAVAHLGNPGTVYILPPIGLVGALFAWGYVYSGSLLPVMAAHFLFNLFSFSVGLATS